MKNYLHKLMALVVVSLFTMGVWATDYITGASNFTVNKIIVSNDNTNGVAREFWSSDENFSFDIYQDIEVPDGVYTFQLQSMYRAHLTKNSITNIALYAHTSGNQYIGRVLNYNEGTVGAENLGSFNTAFSNDANNYLAKIPYFIVTDGKVKVGVRTLSKTPFCGNGHWFIYNPSSFKLSDVTDSGILTSALNDVKHQAEGLLGNSDNSEAKTNLQDAYDAATATSASIVALKEAVDTYLSYLATNGTEENPNDVSFYFINPKFEGSTLRTVGAVNVYNDGGQPFGWVCYEEAGTGTANQGNALADGMGFNHFTVVDNTVSYDEQTPGYSEAPTGKSLYNRFAWAQWSHSTFSTKQSVTLPAGSYKLSVPAFVSESSTNYDAQIIFTINGNVSTQSLVAKTWKVYETEFILTEQAEISVDLQFRKILASANAGKAYAYFDGVTLLCYGDPIAALLTEISTKKGELETYNGRIPAALYSSFNEHLTAAANANNTQSVSALQEILDNLYADITASSNVVAPYVSLQTLITLCTEYTENSNANSTDVLATFQTAISTATTDGNAATTVDAINAAYSTLETARQTYARNAMPVYPYPFDMTFMLPNTTFDSNTDGWIKTGGATWKNAGNVECYNTTFEFSMEYTGLNSGSWEIQVDAFYRYGGYNNAEAAHNGGTEQLHAILYANNNTVAVKSIMEGADKAGSVGATTTNGVRVPNGPADCDAYFATGCYTNAIATVIADGKLKVGIKKETTQGSDWTIFDNFKLIYKGVDITDLQDALSELIEKANAIKEAQMGATESAALTDALTAADAENTNADDLGTMISTLQSAYDAAVASVDLYATVLPYITKAEGIDASIASNYRTQYDNGAIEDEAVTIFQNLEVATYQYVTDNYKYGVALGEWNSTGTNTSAADVKGEHWSDDKEYTYKNQFDGWGDPKQGYPAGSWTIDFDQEVTLPAGEYVFKVAGRKSVDATLELVVTMGETELGTVNDFPSSNEALGINKAGATSFDANDPAGFAKEGKGYGWQWRYVRFVLDEEATVKVAVHAETNAMYNWVSFGDYTLQTNDEANISKIAYNIALRDAENAFNGEQYKIVAGAVRADLGSAIETTPGATKEEIDAAITALTEATAAFTEAFAKYEALNGAISDAEALEDEVNVGTEAFQKPQALLDAVANSVGTYKPALTSETATVAEIEAATEAINTAVNKFKAASLNAPAEGQRFYIKVATEGHSKLGNALLATLGGSSANNPTGYGLNANNAVMGHLAQAFIFTQVEDDRYNISIERAEGTVYLTYGSLNGSAADWKKEQIQATTDATKKGEFKIEVTDKEGVLKIFNTEDNDYIDCQDGGSLYTDGNIEKDEFNIVLASETEVNLTLSSAGWTTVILPFAASVPQGLDVYSCAAVNGDVLTLTQEIKMEANTPYIVYAADNSFTHTFTGFGTATTSTYTNGLLTGTYEEMDAPADSYVLLEKDAVAGFYKVGSEGAVVNANNCYLTAPEGAAETALFKFKDELDTRIQNITTDAETVIYDLAGRRVEKAVKGIYIVNGKKVIK